MAKFLGESEVDIQHTEFAKHTAADWAMEFIYTYGQIDGGHHKQWVLNQVARILKGTPVVVTEARWEGGFSEYRFKTAEPPSKEYLDWVAFCRGPYSESHDCFEYGYDEGIAP